MESQARDVVRNGFQVRCVMWNGSQTSVWYGMDPSTTGGGGSYISQISDLPRYGSSPQFYARPAESSNS